MTESVVTLGADPEMFIVSAEKAEPKNAYDMITGRRRTLYVPACGLFGGDKGAPVIRGPHGGWLEDGVTLELNPSPAKTAEELYRNIKKLMDDANQLLAPQKLKIEAPRSFAHFERSVLTAHPKALEFGCSVDYSAYEPTNPRENIMQRAFEQFGDTIRFAGGHVHLGIDPWPSELPKFVAIRFLDLFLGIPSAFSWDTNDCPRRQFYGKPGIFRETKYGVEYRTPSNYWLAETIDPAFLRRLAGVGKLFSEMDKYGDALVNLYNNVDWEQLQNTYESISYSDLLPAIEAVDSFNRKSGRLTLNDNLHIQLNTHTDPIVEGGNYYVPPERPSSRTTLNTLTTSTVGSAVNFHYVDIAPVQGNVNNVQFVVDVEAPVPEPVHDPLDAWERERELERMRMEEEIRRAEQRMAEQDARARLNRG